MGKLNFVLISLGFAGGVSMGFYLGKRKFEGLADVEVESVKRYYEENYTKRDTKLIKRATEVLEDIPKNLERPSSDDNRLNVKDDISEYKDYSAQYQSEESDTRIPGKPAIDIEKEGAREPDGPYLITPGEFSESTYEAHTLFFYADKVLADDAYNVIHDITGTIGDEALASFGMYEQDCVYVRNDILGIDYEVLIDERYFAKVSTRPVEGVRETD